MSLFGLFGKDALELVRLTLQGDATRLGDFTGYLVLLLICIGIPGAMIYAIIFNTLVKPNTVVKIDPELRIVSVHRDLPWLRTYSAEHAFEDIEAVKLTEGTWTESENHEISIRIPGIRRPLVLAAIFDTQEAHREFQKLNDIGLPVK